MTKTLYAYISRDLAKVMAMAFVGLTGLLTIIGIVEPLRKQGISGVQVLWLFGYTMPVMFTFTLPISALFAATFVYGRLSEDNELLAAKASGISAVNLLKPGLVLGVIVTILTLVLTNYVAPAMVARSQSFVMQEVEGLIFQQLRKKQHVEMGDRVVHVSRFDSQARRFEGAVVIDRKSDEDVRLYVSPKATVHFSREHGKNYVTISLRDTVATGSGDYSMVYIGDTTIESVPLPTMTKEGPAWYNWDELGATLRDPGRNHEIRGLLAKVRQQACLEMLSSRIIDSISGTPDHSYRLDDEEGRYYYVISAGKAEADKRGAKLTADDTPVTIREYLRGKSNVRKTIIADSAEIRATWSTQSKVMKASIEMIGNVAVMIGRGDHRDPPRHSKWKIGSLRVPDDIIAKADAIDLRDYREARKYTKSEDLLKRLFARVGRLQSKIKAEMHGRVAFSLSCCLMIAMGGALGMILRGGQVLAAFAISFGIAILVIMIVFMGKQLVTNPGIPPIVGIGAIWSGLGLLLIGNSYFYVRLMRR